METKLFLIFLLCLNAVRGNENKAAESIPVQRSAFSELSYKFAKIISLAFAERVSGSNPEHGFRVPVLPALPDPLNLGNVTIVDLPLEGIEAEIYLCDSSMVGLSKLTDNLRVLQEGAALRIIYELNTETLTTTGSQRISFNIPESQINFKSGAGDYHLSLVNGLVKLELVVELNIVHQNVTVKATSIDLGFDSININFANAIYNDKPVEWDSVNRDIKQIFEENWPAVKATLDQLLATLLDGLFKDCKTNDIIGLDFSCLGLGQRPANLLAAELETVFRIADENSCLAENVPTTTSSPITSSEPEASSTPSGADYFTSSSASLVVAILTLAYQA